ncbi:uncharacterized protein LOC143956838 [Lithobates pipiens]
MAPSRHDSSQASNTRSRSRTDIVLSETSPDVTPANASPPDGPRSETSSAAINMNDLRTIASDIKDTLSAAIAELRLDLKMLSDRMHTVEKVTESHELDIRRSTRKIDSHTLQLRDMQRHMEDLDNRGRRHNLRVRGLPEVVEGDRLAPAISAIFNSVLDRPSHTAISMDRIHRALRPKGRDTDPPRDVVCCLTDYRLKEDILKAARLKQQISYESAHIQIFQDLSGITLQHRRDLKPLLDVLKSRENATDDVPRAAIWAAHKCVVRGLLISMTAQRRKLKKAHIDELYKRIHLLERAHKRTLAESHLAELTAVRAELLEELQKTLKRKFALTHKLFYESGNKAGGCQKPDNVVSEEKTLYSEGDTLKVQCETGYRPSHDTITCVNRENGVGWDYEAKCIAVCMKPTIDNVDSLSIDKEYYNKSEEVRVQCKSGFPPSSDTMRCDNPPEWSPPTITCIAQCTKPTIGNVYYIYENKDYYNNGESVRVQCNPGYHPSSDTMRCNNPPEWSPPTVTCTAQCTKPTIDNVYYIYQNKEYYNNGESVTVQCNRGYHSSSDTMRCNNPPEWSPPTVTCTAQCSPPIIPNTLESISKYKEYYNKNEEITVRCRSGYYSSTSSTMRCINPRSSWEWTPPTITCIGVTMEDWRVTSSSISRRISCTPQCPDTWRFNVQYCPEPYNYYRSCKTSHGKSVTFTDLQPSSGYRIYTTLYTDQGQYLGALELKYIRTKDSVPGQPEIMKVPSMEDNTIRWRLSEKRGKITRFQLELLSSVNNRLLSTRVLGDLCNSVTFRRNITPVCEYEKMAATEDVASAF